MSHEPDLKQVEHLLKQHSPIPMIPRSQEDRVWDRVMVHTQKSKRYSYVSAAAILLVMIVLAYSFLYQEHRVVGSVTIGSTPSQPLKIRSNQIYRFPSEEASITLDDGSILQLMPGSSLSILSSSSHRIHQDTVVQLHEGTLEANVKQALNHSLYVQTPNLEVRVVGTRFTVQVNKANNNR